MTMLRRKIQLVCKDYDVEFRNGYSGRGMHNKECIGIVTDHKEAMIIIAEVIKELHCDLDDTDSCQPFNNVVDAILDFKTDSMGRDQIFYWEDLKPLTDEEQSLYKHYMELDNANPNDIDE